METLSPIQQLDAVLEFLATSVWAKPPLTDADILKFIKERSNVDLEPGDLLRILNKLVDEKYVHKEAHDNIPYFLKDDQPPSFTNYYSISFDGKLFNEAKGYQQQRITSEEVAYREVIHRRVLLALTWIVSIGTLLAAIFYCTELYWRYHWFH